MIKNFTLIQKKNLTKDVFMLIFTCDNILDIKPWEFITFLLPKTWFWRAYSVFYFYENKIFFIVKRLECWRWWSKELCDVDVWSVLRWVWPSWHFNIKNFDENSLFIWTWTWIVPLFFMLKEIISRKNNTKNKLLWWNRSFSDLYLLDELKNFDNNFSYDICLSQEKIEWYFYWRVTDLITKDYISDFYNFYICWNPNMVNDVIEKLINLWVNHEKIFTEKY